MEIVTGLLSREQLEKELSAIREFFLNLAVTPSYMYGWGCDIDVGRQWQVKPVAMKDVTFISDLIGMLEAEYNIDPTRIYANGLSNGGGMTTWLGCKLSQRIAAAGGYAAAICAAPKVLAGAGLLDGRQATGYPGVLDRLDLPRTELLQRAVVTDGRRDLARPRHRDGLRARADRAPARQEQA